MTNYYKLHHLLLLFNVLKSSGSRTQLHHLNLKRKKKSEKTNLSFPFIVSVSNF